MYDREGRNWRCTACGEALFGSELSGAWRWNGQAYEHRCQAVHPQAGHFVCAPCESAKCGGEGQVNK